MGQKSMFYNHQTQEHEEFNEANLAAYIPQNEAAQKVYQLNVDLGMEPKQAALRTLRLSLGES